MKFLSIFTAIILLGVHSFCHADPGWPGKNNQSYFSVYWYGGGSYHQELQDASVYLESVSNYDGYSVWWPPAKWYAHDLYTNPTSYGYTNCSSASGGFCTGNLTSGVNMTTITEDNHNLRNTWCHELGHGVGAAHETSGEGCVYDYVSITYSSHHIGSHMQY